ncbi:MAG: universal stress protein [Gammaproteobacteria bacterium]|nr:universal stress protein [Gammaproteobacteria bacterium]
MLTVKNILLAYHGTDGAKLAQELAFKLIEPGGGIVHLLVVPGLWAGMQGDDWLNNAATRDEFGHYVEDLLQKDAAEQAAAIAKRCQENGLRYTAVQRVGEPAECLLAAMRETTVDLVIIGPPRSKKISGLRSRMDLEKLARGLSVPLLVANRG